MYDILTRLAGFEPTTRESESRVISPFTIGA